MGIYSRYWFGLPVLKTFPGFSPLLTTLMENERDTLEKHPIHPPPLKQADPEKLHDFFSNPDHKVKVYAEHRPQSDMWVIRTDTFIGNRGQENYESFEMDLKCMEEVLVGVHEESFAKTCYFNREPGLWVRDHAERKMLRGSVLMRLRDQYSPSFSVTREIIPDFDLRQKMTVNETLKRSEEYLARFETNRDTLTEQLHQYDMFDEMSHLLDVRACFKYMAFSNTRKPYQKEQTFTILGYLPTREVVEIDTAKDQAEMKVKMAMLDFMVNDPVLAQNLRAQNVQQDVLMNYHNWKDNNRTMRSSQSSKWNRFVE